MSRYVLLRIDAVEDRGEANVADDLRLGLTNITDPEFREAAVEMIERALPGVTWMVSGVWGP